jgi:GT2 family glycosyltransferase
MVCFTLLLFWLWAWVSIKRIAMVPKPELSIIIVSYNVRDFVLPCIQSLYENAPCVDFEVVVVDNASSDGSVEALRERFPQVALIANPDNIGFARANNQAYTHCHGDLILLLNPDTVVLPGAVNGVLDFMLRTPDAGLAVCRLLNPDRTIQKSIQAFPRLKIHLLQALFLDRLVLSQYRAKTYYRKKPFPIDHASGAFMMVRRQALGEMPLLAPVYFMYSEEKDLSLRLKKMDWKTYFVPQGEVIHYGGQSTGEKAGELYRELMKSQVIYFNKHFSGLRRLLMIWSFYLYMLSSFAASSLFIFSKKGFHRFSLFKNSVYYYPALVKQCSRARQRTVGISRELKPRLKWPRWIEVVHQLMTLPVVSIKMSGCPKCEYYYGYFTKRHPHYKLIKNKKWGVALVALPGSFGDYLKGQDRRALKRNRNRAIGLGYRFAKIVATDHLEKIMDINCSMETRQGLPMPRDYLDKGELKEFLAANLPTYGVFNSDGILKAYAHMLLCGEVAVPVRILGHGEDLEKGIMYYLVSEMVREIIELKIAGLKWLYYDTFFGGARSGLKYFKERCGFKPYRVNWSWGKSDAQRA